MDTNIWTFLLGNFIFIFGVIYISFNLKNYYLKKKGESPEDFWYFINNTGTPTPSSVFVGLLFGIIFGFIDNFGLWLGLDKFHKYLPGGAKTKATLANTYSNFIGAICGVAITVFVENIFNQKRTIFEPLWIDPIGIVIGNLIGIFIGNIIYKDK
jgi:hypothetical protein